MILVDELVKLHEVQKVDFQIYQREQAVKALDSGETQKQQAVAILKRHDVAQTDLQKLTAVLRDRELELKSLEQKKAKVHEKLFSGRVSNPKELGDLQKDEDMLGDQVGRVEEVVLELMDKVEGAKTVEATLAGELSAAKRRWKDIVIHTQQETARLQQEIAALRPERARLAALVEKPLLRRYDDLQQRHEGIGMAVTDNDMCPICHVKLTAHTQGRLREGEELTTCDNCGRILARSAQ